MKTKNNITTFEEMVTRHFGEIGTPERDAFEKEGEAFCLSARLQQTRKEQGLTQEQLAKKCGTSKAYISKLENNLNDIRLSTLRRIVEVGLGGKLDFTISL
jgi:HTH-type transcriptional regulator / antitoxin HipB